MIWIVIVFLALLPRVLAQFSIVKWPSKHGVILIVWAAFSLAVVPYVIFPALRDLVPFPQSANVIYFALFIALAMHFEMRFGPKPKSDDEETE
ncbi:MAG: hypothetical protein HKN27_02575 [Silicimonas sp.]|nr:hypothetical protein [Silicimonas sp.]